METRTICCKLLTDPIITDALQHTSEHFSDACNHVLKIAIAEKTHNAVKLHKLCYSQVRELFRLSANLAVRAIRRVVACMTKLRGKVSFLENLSQKALIMMPAFFFIESLTKRFL